MISATHLAWLQLRREKARLAVAVSGVTFAVILMFMQFGFMDALFRSAVNVHSQLLADLVLVHTNYTTLPRVTRFARRRLYQALGVDGVTSVSLLHTGVARWKNPDNGEIREIFVMGVDPARPALGIPGIEQGLGEIRYPDRVLFDRYSRPEFGPVPAMLEAEREVVTEANLHQLTVRGLFDLGTSFGVDGTIIVSDLTFRRIFPTYPAGAVGIGLVRLEPGADPVAVRDALAARLDRDVRVLTRQEFMAREVAYWATSTPIGFVFSFGVVMGLIVGVIVVYQILFADIADHLPEYATLKAIGYTGRYLAAVVLAEATILALVAFLPGGLAAWRLYALTRAATMLPMDLVPARVALVLGLTLVMCWLSGLIAMRKLRSAKPAEML
jgi:putative ABC transport system permease protein